MIEASELRRQAYTSNLRLLERATAHEGKAERTKIDWLVEQDGERQVEFNYTQIFRGGSAHEVAKLIEYALRYGERRLDLSGGEPIGSMGGWEQLLGRPPTPYDVFDLRVLFGLTHLRGDLFRERDEWLAEVSLVAIAGEPE